jgi:hypothetical protein
MEQLFSTHVFAYCSHWAFAAVELVMFGQHAASAAHFGPGFVHEAPLSTAPLVPPAPLAPPRPLAPPAPPLPPAPPAPASTGATEAAQPFTVTIPTLFDPLFAHVAAAELLTV